METFMPVPGETYKGPMMPQFILTQEITFGAKVMYAVLCDCSARYNADHCFPSHSTLAKLLSCGVTSVKRYLAELTKAKLIRIKYKEQHSNYYYMLRHDALKGADSAAVQHEPERVQQPRVASPAPKPVRQQPKMDYTPSKVACPQAKVGYVSNLNIQPEENTKPPLPPHAAERAESIACLQSAYGGGCGFFFL